MKYFYPRMNAEMPGKSDHLQLTPNQAPREMAERLEEKGIETFLERFEAQQPQCGFGLRGICCQRCLWGPCRIGPRSRRGICGNDADLVIMGNLLRGLAAGCAAHGRHAQEVAETILAAAEGDSAYEVRGESTLLDVAQRLGVETAGQDTRSLAGRVARVFLEDLGRAEDAPMRTLLAFAPPDRLELWRRLGIIPRSAMYEVFEAMHMTTVGSCSDLRTLAFQELRTALAYCYSTLFTSSLGAEILFGVPEPSELEVGTKVDYGVLEADHVNVLIHGHSPVLAEKVVEAASDPGILALARSRGAKGIRLGGLCCTGQELLSRHGVPSITGILGVELVLATGAVDALVIDMQCAIPGLKEVAGCFGTRLITTCRSNRFRGALHVDWNPMNAGERARDILRAAVEAYSRRKPADARIPSKVSRAVAGWTPASISERFGGYSNLVRLIQEGQIRGIVSIAGCNSPKVPYENGHVTIATRLIESGVLVLTTGCAAYALLNAGLASMDAAEGAGWGLGQVCRSYGIPPVLVLGACTDNTRLIALYSELSRVARVPLSRMPFCHSGPEPGSEKNLGQGVQFLCHGISVHQGFPGGIPVPLPVQKEGAKAMDDMELEITGVARFFAVEAMEVLGARAFTEPYPVLAANAIRLHVHRQRLGLGWS